MIYGWWEFRWMKEKNIWMTRDLVEHDRDEWITIFRIRNGRMYIVHPDPYLIIHIYYSGVDKGQVEIAMHRHVHMNSVYTVTYITCFIQTLSTRISVSCDPNFKFKFKFKLTCYTYTSVKALPATCLFVCRCRFSICGCTGGWRFRIGFKRDVILDITH